jgi:hypothetical protein
MCRLIALQAILSRFQFSADRRRVLYRVGLGYAALSQSNTEVGETDI